MGRDDLECDPNRMYTYCYNEVDDEKEEDETKSAMTRMKRNK